VKFILFLASIPGLIPAAIIPQSGFSGRPGDGTCRDCHAVKALVPVDSSVILGLPDALAPGTVYACTLVIRHKGLCEWAFEMTTVDSQSVQAGFIRPVDSIHTSVDTLEDILYFKNTLRGAYVGRPDSARWAFEYVTPPAETGRAWFYWCAYMKDRRAGRSYHVFESSLSRSLVAED
jgi:hypothetical protein